LGKRNKRTQGHKETKKKDSIHLGQHWWFKNYFLTPTQGIWVGFKTLINIVNKLYWALVKREG
jgi:hypothetical protein